MHPGFDQNLPRWYETNQQAIEKQITQTLEGKQIGKTTNHYIEKTRKPNVLLKLGHHLILMVLSG
jgi:hypothetical protein